MMNFVMTTVKAFSKTEAENQVNFQIFKDATQKWKNAGKPMIASELKAFCAEYLEKNTKSAPGLGCMIVLEPGVENSRVCPFKKIDVKTEGKRSYKKAFQAIDTVTNEVLLTTMGKKSDAYKAVRDLCVSRGITHKVRVNYIKVVTEGESAAFELEYTPSTNTKEGTYILFGVNKD